MRQKEHHKQKVLEVLNSMFTIHKQISKMVSDQVLQNYETISKSNKRSIARNKGFILVEIYFYAVPG